MADNNQPNQSSRANSRGSYSGASHSALSTLFATDSKISLDSNLVEKKEEFEAKSLSQQSYQESYTYSAASYNYAANSFYQSYGESFNSFPQQSFVGVEAENQNNMIEDENTNALSKPLVSVKELLSIIVEDATYKYCDNGSLDNRLFLNGEVDLHTKIESLRLLPAEEDGSPMADLPDCTSSSDILNMGVRDFIILDKRSKLQLVHIRIEGNITPNKPYEGNLAANNNVQIVLEEHPLTREESLQTEDSYYTLDDSDRDSLRNADTIQFFRTDTDELKLQELQKALEDLREQEKHDALREKRFSKSHRNRSSSGNLVISYRRPNSERWRVAKKLAVLTENDSLETSRPISKERKADIAQQVRQQLMDPKAVPIPDPRNLLKYEITDNATSEILDRRHSERPYDEEQDGDFDKMKYARKYSQPNSRSSSVMDLNPHTSIVLSAQFSPAGSIHSHGDDSDDDQLGLIQLARTTNSLSFVSPTSFNGRSLGRDESTYALPFMNNSSGKAGSADFQNKLNVSPRNAAKNQNLRSFYLQHNDDTQQENSGSNRKLKLTVSDSDGSDSSDTAESIPTTHLNVNTDFIAISTHNSNRSTPNHVNPRKSPSKISSLRFPTQGYEKDGDNSSDNGSSKGSVTSNKSVVGRLFDLFGSRKRPSFASDSNDSIPSIPSTPQHRRGDLSNDGDRPSRILPSRQISLPIIQNLDTGDIFPIGALRYDAFKLPETVSPSVLFGKPSDKIQR